VLRPALVLGLLALTGTALAHNISDSNASFVAQLNGPAVA
jgi:hypothetical protein